MQQLLDALELAARSGEDANVIKLKDAVFELFHSTIVLVEGVRRDAGEALH